MHVWVLTKDEKFLDVCTKEVVVLNWAKVWGATPYVRCTKHDDVGVYEGEVDLFMTKRMKQVILVSQPN